MSRLPFELMLALRYLRPKRTFVSVITLISIVGVALGVAVLIIVISVMTGFDRQLREKIVGFNAHLRIEAAQGPLRDYERVMASVAPSPAVKGVAPYVLGQVMVKTQPAEGNPRVVAPLLRGIDPQREGAISLLPSSVKAGAYDVRGYGILVGRALAEQMKVRVGDALAVYSVNALEKWESSRKKGSEEAPLAEDYVVKGIFEVGFHDFDSAYVLCSLPNAQDLYDLGEGVHGLLVSLHDPEQAEAARAALLGKLGAGFEITTWMEENSAILEALVVEKNVMFYLLFFITIVAAFGITSALITFVVQKTREIGTLKALGATSGQVMWLFLSQSLAVGVVGVICGFGLGMLAVLYRNQFLHLMRRLTGFELFPSRIYQFTELPGLIVPGDIAIICGGSLIICLLAGVLPAWNAGRLRPVEALRHE
jgi:lipoprotein-releasing system permease protein